MLFRSGEGDAVGHDDVIADVHVVGDVGVGHEQVVAADDGEQSSALGAAMDGDEFAEPYRRTFRGSEYQRDPISEGAPDLVRPGG